ncbi:MAG: class I SAM-dependent methyltransferase, partial [Phycisphaerae bacterium]
MTNPPRSAELKDLYSNTVFTLPGNDQYYEDDPTNLAAARARRRWVERSVSSGRLLDIGCGCGHFLAVLNSRRWSAQGIDISPLAVRRARQRFNVRC